MSERRFLAPFRASAVAAFWRSGRAYGYTWQRALSVCISSKDEEDTFRFHSEPAPGYASRTGEFACRRTIEA